MAVTVQNDNTESNNTRIGKKKIQPRVIRQGDWCMEEQSE